MSASDLFAIVTGYRPLPGGAVLADIRSHAFRDPKWLYDDVALSRDPGSVWQGDVLPTAVLAWIDDYSAIQGYEGPAMVLSHGCDSVPDRDIVTTLAPAFGIIEYLDLIGRMPATISANDRERNIRANQQSNLFLLPARGLDPELVVDFSFAAAVSTRLLTTMSIAAGMGRRRLSDAGWYLFTAKLAHHVARLERAEDYPRH